MATVSPLTGMQQHVFDHLSEVVMQQGPKEPRYGLRGKEVNSQITTLLVKGLIVQDGLGRLSVR